MEESFIRNLPKIGRIVENKYISYRKIAIILYDVENYKKDIARNNEQSEYIIKRVNVIDEHVEDKIYTALQKMDFRPLPFNVEEARKRLRNEYRFVVIEHRDAFIGWTWDAVNFIYIPELEETIKLKEKEAFSFNTYIQKEYRNKGLNKKMLHTKIFLLHEEQFTKEWGHIWYWNKPSLASFTHMGWKIIGTCHYFKFLNIKLRYRTYNKKECTI